MRYLSVDEIVALHAIVVSDAGSRLELRDRGVLESAAAQPSMGFGETEAYPTLAAKAAALRFSLVRNLRSSTATNASGTLRRKCS